MAVTWASTITSTATQAAPVRLSAVISKLKGSKVYDLVSKRVSELLRILAASAGGRPRISPGWLEPVENLSDKSIMDWGEVRFPG